jgi:putative transcriptional regulator
MPNLFDSNQPSIHYESTSQKMRIRLLFLLCIGTLLFGGWSTMLHAEVPGQLPRVSDTPAFLLVASQHMADPRFRKTVLLVTRHGKSGPIGVIVNRPENITLDNMLPEYPAAKKFSLFNGGPVFPAQVSYLVRGGDAVKNALTISSNIYLAYDVPILGELLSGKRRYKDLRVMHGLASWAPGQLEYEIKLGDWHTLPIDDAVIFNIPPADMWQELHDRATRYHEI